MAWLDNADWPYMAVFSVELDHIGSDSYGKSYMGPIQNPNFTKTTIFGQSPRFYCLLCLFWPPVRGGEIAPRAMNPLKYTIKS